MKRTSPFFFYFIYCAAIAFLTPFIILYFQGLGFNGAQVGILAGMTPLVIMLGSSVWPMLADATHRHRLILSLTILFTVLIASIFPLLRSFTSVVLLVFVYGLIAAPIMPFADSATMSMLADEKDMYGRVRLGGTLGWGLVAPLAGWVIGRYGIQWAFWGYSAILMITLLIVQRFTFGRMTRQGSMKAETRQLLSDRRWVQFLAMVFVSGIAFSVVNSYLFPYMEEQGINRSMMGFALTIASFSELPVMFFANHLLRRFKGHGLLVLGMILTGVRLLLYVVFITPAGILGFQLLTGMTQPLVWVAAVSLANEYAPEGMKATGQGLMTATTYGIGAAAGGLLGGVLMGSLGGRGMFLVVGLFMLLGVGVFTLVKWSPQPAVNKVG